MKTNSQTRTLRGAGETEQWLASTLGLVRVGRLDSRSGKTIVPWLLSALANQSWLPPLGIYVDIGRLLQGEPLDFSAAPVVSDGRLRSGLRQYEDHVLGRLTADRRFEDLRDAYVALDDDQRPAAVSVLVEHVLDSLSFKGGVALNTAAARRVLARPAEELFGGPASVRQPQGDEIAPLVQSYEALVQGARHARVLLHDRDVFVMENLTVLSRLSQRVAIEQMVDAGEQLERSLPRRVRQSPRRGSTVTAIQDDSAYPSGGFSAVSTAGAIENLVCSELVYMDQVGRSDGVDLFDVRYTEGELLYYTRDDNVFVRQRRAFVIVLGSDLPAARFSDAGLPWQRLVLVFALLYSLIQRLGEWLGAVALSFELVFVADQTGHCPLAEERELCQLLLGEWIEKGVVRLVEARGEDACEHARHQGKRAAVDLLLVTTAGDRLPPQLLETKLVQRVRSGVLDISGAVPRFFRLPRREEAAGFPGALPRREVAQEPWPAWLAVAAEVAKALI